MAVMASKPTTAGRGLKTGPGRPAANGVQTASNTVRRKSRLSPANRDPWPLQAISRRRCHPAWTYHCARRCVPMTVAYVIARFAALATVAVFALWSMKSPTIREAPAVTSTPAVVGRTAVMECGNHVHQDGESDEQVVVSDDRDVEVVEEPGTDDRDCFDSLVSDLKHPPITRPGEGRAPSDNTPPKH